jgi:hypothetical protein
MSVYALPEVMTALPVPPFSRTKCCNRHAFSIEPMEFLNRLSHMFWPPAKPVRAEPAEEPAGTGF